MEFIAKYFLYGALFAGPVDRSHFPVQVETDYTPPTVGDQVERWELAGSDRILIRRGQLVGGRFEEDTVELSGSTLLLDAEGHIRARCGGRDCDYRENGWEYVRENGRYVRMRSWAEGEAAKTWEFRHEDGRLISGSEGLLMVSWYGWNITRQSWMVRQEPPPLFHVLTYTYDSSSVNPLSDTVVVESENPFGEPRKAMQIHRLYGGRLTSRVEYDMANYNVYSRTTYQYQAPLALPVLAPRAVSAPWVRIPSVDALGRFRSVRRENPDAGNLFPAAGVQYVQNHVHNRNRRHGKLGDAD